MHIYIMYICIRTRSSTSPACLGVHFADFAHCLAQVGKLPLYHALANKAVPEVVLRLLDAYRDAARIADEVGCEGLKERCVYSVFMCALCMCMCFCFILMHFCVCIHVYIS